MDESPTLVVHGKLTLAFASRKPAGIRRATCS